MENYFCAVILAGGEGKRMKSEKPKALSEVLFQPMLQWVLDAVRAAGIEDICVVTGYKKEYIERYISDLEYPVETVYQAERLGTGHAVMQAQKFIEAHKSGKVLILNGDAPFMDGETICKAAKFHNNDAQNGCTVITAAVDNPTGYGRIIRKVENGQSTDILQCIVEEKEATPEQRFVREINSGAMWFQAEALLNALNQLVPSEKTGEYYLTDTIEIIRKNGQNVYAFQTENAEAVLGANDCLQLHQLNETARQHILADFMRNGVNIPCTDGVIIGKNVRIGKGVTLLPSTILKNGTIIGNGCTIGPAVLLDCCTVGDNKTIVCGCFEKEIL
ncbi:MAG: sugar phosphate nucleotidyltransferase [Acutalibacteraceae bacterium]